MKLMKLNFWCENFLISMHIGVIQIIHGKHILWKKDEWILKHFSSKTNSIFHKLFQVLLCIHYILMSFYLLPLPTKVMTMCWKRIDDWWSHIMYHCVQGPHKINMQNSQKPHLLFEKMPILSSEIVGPQWHKTIPHFLYQRSFHLYSSLFRSVLSLRSEVNWKYVITKH